MGDSSNIVGLRSQEMGESVEESRQKSIEEYLAPGMTPEDLPGFAELCESSPNSSMFGSNYKDVYAFIVLILVLVFRPQGLLGERVGDRA